MKPMHLVQKAHAIVLAGGSAFGLDAASGAVRYLEERGIGFDVRVAKVPIVPAAILFDLGIGKSKVRPDAAMGYAACQNASSERPAEGNWGAGTGATVGKIFGVGQATKAGIGTASVDLGGGVIVGAIVAVNAFGDVIEPSTGQILAGARKPDLLKKPDFLPALAVRPGEKPGFSAHVHFADTLATAKGLIGKTVLRFARGGENTVIGVVATNAKLDKEQVCKVAQMADDGLARAVRPAHTLYDGDTIFALSLGAKSADVNLVGAYAAEMVARAIVNAVLAAEPAGGLPAVSSFRHKRPGQVIVRARQAGDDESLRLVVESLPGWFPPGAWDKMQADLVSKPALVAEIDGEPLGLVCWESIAHIEPGAVNIAWLAVHRDWRGRELGRALLRVMEDKLRNQGDVNSVQVWTVADSEHYPPYAETRAFYRAMGYEDAYVDVVNRTPASGDKLFMRKRLNV
jgi:L-aminopeptidase/D-esterase-like protein/GNAT superfamily N-acetyltransferase